jgi:ferritin
MAAKKSFGKALNAQISNEFAASQQYVAMAVYYDSETLPRLASFFYRQAVEEREHAMMMIQYLLDVDEEVKVPDIKSQPTRYKDGITPV